MKLALMVLSKLKATTSELRSKTEKLLILGGVVSGIKLETCLPRKNGMGETGFPAIPLRLMSSVLAWGK